MAGSFKSTLGSTTCNNALARFNWLSRASMYWGVAFRRRFEGWSYVLAESQFFSIFAMCGYLRERGRGQFTILRDVSGYTQDDGTNIGYTHGCQHTIAVHGAMCARLLAIAFNLLAPTLVTGTCHTPSFLWLRLGWLIVADVIGLGVAFAKL